MKKGFTLIELLIVLAIVGIIILTAGVMAWKFFIAESVNDGVQAVKASVVNTTSLKCVDAQGRELMSYVGLQNACRVGDQFRITSSDGTVRFISAAGCSPTCAGNSPVDCGQVCR